jgi:crotonobetainyl-CoA:carnitine CoA-transferase CaiB-like acyl-CoA transferase
VAALEDRFWRRFCELTDLPEDATQDMVAKRIRSQPSTHWGELLEPEDACVNVVRTLAEAVANPQFSVLFRAVIEQYAPIPQLPLPAGGHPAARD